MSALARGLEQNVAARPDRRTARGKRSAAPARNISVAALGLLTAVGLFTACGSELTAVDTSDADASVQASSASVQFSVIAREITTPPAVTIRDRQGRALGARRVRFLLTNSSGSTTELRSTTDSSGRAEFPRMRLNDAGRYHVEARMGVASAVRFSILALPETLLGSGTATRCPLLDPILPHFGGIPRTATLLKEGRTLTIVAFGSSSTFGTGASDSSLSFPSQFHRELQSVFPRSTIRLINAGVPGNNSLDLDARLERDVLAHGPNLVILQTGTNDALQSVPLSSMRAATERTIHRLRERGIEVVLLDSQRFRGAGESDLYLTYVQAVADIGSTLGVSTARRYGWMSAILAAQRYGYADLLLGDGLHQSDLASECTAHLLATGVSATVFGGEP